MLLIVIINIIAMLHDTWKTFLVKKHRAFVVGDVAEIMLHIQSMQWIFWILFAAPVADGI